MIQLSFQGKGKKWMSMDLTKSGDAIIAWLEPHVTRMSGKAFDRVNYELSVTPCQKSDDDTITTPLDSFDELWESVQELVKDNRGDPDSKKPEFRFDIA